MMHLTAENYYSQEANMEYMSTSYFKEFRKCEAKALAKLRGEWEDEKSTALLVGSYVDANFEGTLDLFKAQNPEIFTKQGELKADYRYAEYIIQRIERDPLFMLLMSGKKQVIKTGVIGGVPFKIKIDSYLDADICHEIVRRFPKTEKVFGFCDGAIVDMKIMADFESKWDAEDQMRIPFISYWGYDYQGAIYQKVEGNGLPFIIAGATKEKPEPNIELFYIPQNDLNACLQTVEYYAKRFHDLKHGIGEPYSCGRCDYCRSHKILTNIIDYREVI
jgi:hypothetical protein